MGRNDPIPADLENKVLDGVYRLDERIDQSDKSHIFSGEEIDPKSPGRKVLVKVFKPRDDRDVEGNFNLEKKVHGLFGEHPNIANIYGSGRDGDYRYIVMGRAPGKNLKQYIQDGGTLSLEKILAIATSIGGAAEHMRQVLKREPELRVSGHRDIKANNIIFDGDSSIVLADFGGRKNPSPGENDVFSLGWLLHDLEYASSDEVTEWIKKGLLQISRDAMIIPFESEIAYTPPKNLITGAIMDADRGEVVYETPGDLVDRLNKFSKEVRFKKITRRTLIGAGIGLLCTGAAWGLYELNKAQEEKREKQRKAREEQKKYKVSLEYAVEEVRKTDPLSKEFVAAMPEVRKRICYQKSLLLANKLPLDEFPYAVPPGSNEWFKVDQSHWVAGFFPGMLWDAFEYTGDEQFKDLAMQRVNQIKLVEKDRSQITPFRFYYSHVKGFEITGDERLRDEALAAAKMLKGRFNPIGKYFQLLGELNLSSKQISVVSSVHTLPLLSWAYKQTDDRSISDMIKQQCETIRKYHLHPSGDGSTLQVVGFDLKDRKVRKGMPADGFSGLSCPARGQMHTLRGLIAGYEITGEKKFLDDAALVEEYAWNNLPADKVTFYDFKDPNKPNIPRDASSPGVLERQAMHRLTNDSKYLQRADIITHSLTGRYVRFDPSKQGIIDKATKSVPKKEYVGTPLFKGDADYFSSLKRFS